ncbi:hypothetical protein [Mesorhizobium sp.]|uniref:hypothetical protein n=1 Tax=Mesorhizobium sp. TaxID=1871066 RepID=UPI000FE59DFD|nr:hypothetical protein [Mesorhizobium sp.]RWP30658.1 MAG: hypothetical protein EOR03_24045 [Mesorhizobium sp.]
MSTIGQASANVALISRRQRFSGARAGFDRRHFFAYPIAARRQKRAGSRVSARKMAVIGPDSALTERLVHEMGFYGKRLAQGKS